MIINPQSHESGRSGQDDKINTSEPVNDLMIEKNQSDARSEISRGIRSNPHVCENKELGVAYQETTIRVPEHKKLVTGISMIRRKEITKMPEGLDISSLRQISDSDFYGEDSPHEKLLPIIHFLTEGALPSFRTWNHAMNADMDSIRETALQNFRTEGMYFQKIVPKLAQRIGLHSDCFFRRVDGQIYPDPETKTYDDNAVLLYPMSVGESAEGVWSARSGPIFIFGNRNKAFAHYVSSILAHPETRQMLESKGWDLSSHIALEKTHLDPSKLSMGASLALQGMGGEDVFQTKDGPKQGEQLTDEKIKKYSEIVKSADALKFLIEGKAVTYGWPHPRIPVIQHPDIAPLRWCHSDVAIITTDANIYVLFFE